MLRTWRAKRLITKLTGLRATNRRLSDLLAGVDSIPQHYIDKSLGLAQQIAELEFKIECLKDGK